MTPDVASIPLSDIRFNQELYPRRKHDPALVQRYADALDRIEATKKYISIAADGTLVDGRHRQLAYLSRYEGESGRMIPAFRYAVTTPSEIFALAVELNNGHGQQLSLEDKRDSATRLYSDYGHTLEDIARRVSTSKTKVSEWLSDTIKAERERRNRHIFELWLRCETLAEVQEKLSLDKSTAGDVVRVCREKYSSTVPYKLAMDYEEDGWQSPVCNVWTFGKSTNTAEHFGQSEQRILDNLLYLYTKPFEIVVDPFAGGGSTIDVCERRFRRYWVSDRKPKVERGDAVRELDIADGPPPLDNRWSEVALMYLDPPYWRQAAGQYSKDAEDLANMDLEAFYAALVGYIKACAGKMRSGSHIALLIQPTMWLADDRWPVDHITDLVQRVGNGRVRHRRFSCPYSTEQYNAQQVRWAQDNKNPLVLTRELIVWQVAA
jgi:DNA modification methylase